MALEAGSEPRALRRARRFALLATLASAFAVCPSPRAEAVVARDACATAIVVCEESTHTYSATAPDWNRDGLQDIFLVRHFDGFPHLYSGIGGGAFIDSTHHRFEGARRRDWHDCAWGDVNGDGRLDVYCTVGGKGGGTAPNNKHLWLQRPNGTFEDVTRQYGVADRFGRGRVTSFLDANGDRFPDLFVGNTFPRQDGRRSPNRLFVNVDGERFRQAPRFGVTRQVGAKTVAAAEFNRDSREDLLLCGRNRLFLYENRGNRRFADATRKRRLPHDCKGAEFGNLRKGGGREIIVWTSSSLSVYTRRGERFRRVFRRRGVGGLWDVSPGDVNGDGRDDLYVLRQGRLNRDRSDLMLVNRRGARRFARKRIPQYHRGKGDAVQAIDHDGNGLDDFIVMQGYRNRAGPIRLVAFYKN